MELVGIGQSVELERALDSEVMSSNLPAVPEVTLVILAVASPY